MASNGQFPALEKSAAAQVTLLETRQIILLSRITALADRIIHVKKHGNTCQNDESCSPPVIIVPRQYAKSCKDALKSRSWLDERYKLTKVPAGMALPVHELSASRAAELVAAITMRCTSSLCRLNLPVIARPSAWHGLGSKPSGQQKLQDSSRGCRHACLALEAALLEALLRHGVAAEEARRALQAVPHAQFEQLGDLLLLLPGVLEGPPWSEVAGLWEAVASALCSRRIARMEARALSPSLLGVATEGCMARMLHGSSGWAACRVGGIHISLDVTQSAIVLGGREEMERLAALIQPREVVVQVEAGSGTCVQPFLSSGAQIVHAHVSHPRAEICLHHDLTRAQMDSRCIMHQNLEQLAAACDGAADRVHAGLRAWDVASESVLWQSVVRCLRRQGGAVHVQGCFCDVQGRDAVAQWAKELESVLADAAANLGRRWRVRALRAESLGSVATPTAGRAVMAAIDLQCVAEPSPRATTDEPRPPPAEPPGVAAGCSTSPLPVRRVRCADRAAFERDVVAVGTPAILTGVGALEGCLQGWSAEQLVGRVEAYSERHPDGRQVPVHVSPSPTIDLAGHRRPNTPRNFEFVKMPFGQLLRRIFHLPRRGTPDTQLPPVMASGERYYLRSVAEDDRQASHLPTMFPELAEDLRDMLGPDWLIPADAYHSSVMRISSGTTRLWMHYDTMDNLLAQVVGSKRVVLYPPSEAAFLYVEGSSSRIDDIDAPDSKMFPMFTQAVGRA
ncbi:hypothetical protein CYMTET_19341, partial [Cymbomonas tetramitiformis]